MPTCRLSTGRPLPGCWLGFCYATLPLAEVKDRFSSVVDGVTTTHEAVTVTRNGEPVVVVLAGDDYESLTETMALAFDEEGRSRLTEADESIGAGDVTTGDEMAELVRERAEREARGRGLTATSWSSPAVLVLDVAGRADAYRPCREAT